MAINNKFDELYNYIDEHYNIIEVFDENNIGTKYIEFSMKRHRYLVSYNKRSNSFVISRGEDDVFYSGQSLITLIGAIANEFDRI